MARVKPNGMDLKVILKFVMTFQLKMNLEQIVRILIMIGSKKGHSEVSPKTPEA